MKLTYKNYKIEITKNARVFSIVVFITAQGD